MYVISHVTLQDYTIEWSVDFIGGSSLLYGTYLPSLVVIGIVAGIVAVEI